MNRKVTALLLAMTFILSTMAPTMAMAETGKTGTKTTAVSVEKPKEKSKFAAFVEKLIGVKEAIGGDKKEKPLKDTGTDTPKAGEDPAAGGDQQNENSFEVFSLSQGSPIFLSSFEIFSFAPVTTSVPSFTIKEISNFSV